jgi:MFS family permease
VWKSPLVNRLVTKHFVVLCLSGLAYFVALGIPVTVLPVQVEQTLGGGDLEIGLSAGAFGVAAAVLRPFVGPLGDRRGRRFMVCGGSLVVGLGFVLAAVLGSIPGLVLSRLVMGAGEAMFFTGLAAAIQDLAPPDRRGEAASYFSVVVYIGFVVGPSIGELISEAFSAGVAYWVAAGLCAVGVLFGLRAPGATQGAALAPRPRGLLHRQAIRPAVVLGVGLLGYSGFVAFAAVHSDDVGIERVGIVFAVYAVVVLTLRILAAKVPDRLGPRRTSAMALSTSAIGLLILAAVATPTGVYAGTAVLAAGQTFLFPALFALVVDEAGDDERSHAIATFSLGFDLSVGAGGGLLGIVSELVSRRFVFACGAVICLVALVLAQRLLSVTPRPSTVS